MRPVCCDTSAAPSELPRGIRLGRDALRSVGSEGTGSPIESLNSPAPDSPSTEYPTDPARYHVFPFHSTNLPDPQDRNIAVYLPVAYHAEPDRRFSVMYLHDGQNLFDGRTSYITGSTWRAHSTADRLAAANLAEPLILVGIANTGLRRMAEYTPTRDMRMGGGEGDRYGRLLVEELKPLIDARYRTLTGPAHTGIGGSSLGGLISLYLGLQYRDVFGKVAAMSPSLWWDQRSLFARLRRASPEPPLRIWLDMGTAEGVRHLRDTDLLYSLLLERGWERGQTLFYVRDEGALHNEEAWARRLPEALEFLFPPTQS